MSKATADIGLVGLAVMGENLVLNMESKGFTVAVYNRTTSKVDEFVEGRAKGKNIIGTRTTEELVAALKTPRKVMIMVRAGKPVDYVIESLVPLLEKGDIIIDGGNSHFPDSNRRTKELEALGLLFIGTGVSGGEEGALHGPSMMPGGSPAAWPAVKDIFQSICAKVEDGSPCCDWVGEEGAGHYVKMVHNGIEYGDMQLICEAYDIMKRVMGYSNEQIHDVFAKWNTGVLDSYLIEITRDIFAKKHEEVPDAYVVDLVLDRAGQKGTGKWTADEALNHGIPVTLIAEAVFARSLSALKDDRVEASKVLSGPEPRAALDGKAEQQLLKDLEDAVYGAKLVSYAQGFSLLREAARVYGWKLNYGGVALMWRGGCIIRSKFLNNIKEAFDNDGELTNLLLDPFFKDRIHAAQAGWRRVVSTAVLHGIPVPASSTALAYFDGFRTARLPANLLQSQRDFFGAHTYERVDRPRGEHFHTNWTGRGGTTSASTYSTM